MKHIIFILLATLVAGVILPADAEARRTRRYDTPTYWTKDHVYDNNPYTAAITQDPFKCQESVVRTAVKEAVGNKNKPVAKRANCTTKTEDKTAH